MSSLVVAWQRFPTMYIPLLQCSRRYRLETVSHGRNSWPLTPSSAWPLLATPRYHRRALPSDSELACLACPKERELLYDWQFAANQFVLARSPLKLTISNFIFQLNTCGCSPCVTSSLTRGWVCRLQLLLVLTSAVILRSESQRTNDHILLSQIRDSPNLEGQVPVFMSQGTGCSVILPGIRSYFRRLLRLAGWRWRYATPPPQLALPI
jgi:hypothetical protein